jgi:hypothetical protein
VTKNSVRKVRALLASSPNGRHEYGASDLCGIGAKDVVTAELID